MICYTFFLLISVDSCTIAIFLIFDEFSFCLKYVLSETFPFQKHQNEFAAISQFILIFSVNYFPVDNPIPIMTNPNDFLIVPLN